MRLAFSDEAWEDYLHWQARGGAVLAKLNRLIEECRRTPFSGTGKPEPLRGDQAKWWSRRLTDEHRLVYRVIGKGEDQTLEIAQCRFHY